MLTSLTGVTGLATPMAIRWQQEEGEDQEDLAPKLTSTSHGLVVDRVEAV